MKVRIKSYEEILKYKKIGRGEFPEPGFISDEVFKNWISERITDFSTHPQHSMEYYCGKIIEIDCRNTFANWKWADWMYSTKVFDKVFDKDLQIE